MKDKSAVPILDFSVASIDNKDLPGETDEAMKSLKEQMYDACTRYGAFYITNHGITEDEVTKSFDTADRFFTMDGDIKRQYVRKSKVDVTGWDEYGREIGDMKEEYDVSEIFEDSINLPKELPEFKSHGRFIYKKLVDLSNRIMEVLSLSIKTDPNTLLSAHDKMGYNDNCSVLRFCYYPAVADDKNYQPGKLRCGEHTDFGSLTLLFHDEQGGLEVADKDGVWSPAPPIKGACIVLVGDLLQKWTSDRLIASNHRVVVPESEEARGIRRVIIFFNNPNNDATVKCLDGLDKYPPFSAREYFNKMKDYYLVF